MPIVKGKPIKGMPLVTSIIPAYKEEKNIAACIEALLAQTYPNLEIIVVENGESNDRTYEIARKYAKKHKNVRAFTIPGPQKGPANALIFGFKKSKGKIISLVGADLIYGKHYISRGIVPVLKGESIGVNHIEEKCKNLHSLWARAFFYKRSFVQPNGLTKVFIIIRKDYLKDKLWDPSLGYADDQTINIKYGTEFLPVDLEVYQNNPGTFKEIWEHGLWIGKSMKISPWLVILSLPLFPLYALYKTARHIIKDDFYLPFVFFLPVYYSVRHLSYFVGSLNRLGKK